jgi:hypothetical protein
VLRQRVWFLTPFSISCTTPQGSRLTLSRLVLTGLAPAAAPASFASMAGLVSPALLANLSGLLWAWAFPRNKQPMLRLANVTLLVPPQELAVVAQVGVVARVFCHRPGGVQVAGQRLACACSLLPGGLVGAAGGMWARTS